MRRNRGELQDEAYSYCYRKLDLPHIYKNQAKSSAFVGFEVHTFLCCVIAKWVHLTCTPNPTHDLDYFL
jgi:hypothetical protein